VLAHRHVQESRAAKAWNSFRRERLSDIAGRFGASRKWTRSASDPYLYRIREIIASNRQLNLDLGVTAAYPVAYYTVPVITVQSAALAAVTTLALSLALLPRGAFAQEAARPVPPKWNSRPAACTKQPPAH